MRPDKRDAGYLWDMLETARGVVAMVANLTLERYLANEDARMAMERRIQLIGEAARGVSEAFRQAHPEIPWRGMIAQRNVLVHEYGDVDDESIWDVATVHVPALIRKIEPLIPPIPPDVEA